MYIADNQTMSVDEALAHFGVKGMKWGVRKDDTSGGGGDKQPGGVASVAGKKTAQATTAMGAIAVGKMLGTAAGAPLGPGGMIVGGFAGSYAAGRIVRKSREKSEKQERDAALADVDKFLGNRNSKYTEKMIKADMEKWNPDATKRINNSMNSGMSRNDAFEAERKLQFRASATTFGATFVTRSLARSVGRTAVSSLKSGTKQRAVRKNAERASNARNANLRGLPAPLKVTKATRDGVHKVTSL